MSLYIERVLLIPFYFMSNLLLNTIFTKIGWKMCSYFTITKDIFICSLLLRFFEAGTVFHIHAHWPEELFNCFNILLLHKQKYEKTINYHKVDFVQVRFEPIQYLLQHMFHLFWIFSFWFMFVMVTIERNNKKP